jgi:colicin import membrane protein
MTKTPAEQELEWAAQRLADASQAMDAARRAVDAEDQVKLAAAREALMQLEADKLRKQQEMQRRAQEIDDKVAKRKAEEEAKQVAQRNAELSRQREAEQVVNRAEEALRIRRERDLAVKNVQDQVFMAETEAKRVKAEADRAAHAAAIPKETPAYVPNFEQAPMPVSNEEIRLVLIKMYSQPVVDAAIAHLNRTWSPKPLQTYLVENFKPIT